MTHSSARSLVPTWSMSTPSTARISLFDQPTQQSWLLVHSLYHINRTYGLKHADAQSGLVGNLHAGGNGDATQSE